VDLAGFIGSGAATFGDPNYNLTTGTANGIALADHAIVTAT
jgi:hypothetical protein